MQDQRNRCIPNAVQSEAAQRLADEHGRVEQRNDAESFVLDVFGDLGGALETIVAHLGVVEVERDGHEVWR